jgi:molecular chaperone HtpG
LLIIPRFIQDKIEENIECNAFVTSSINNLRAWIEKNNTQFFKEYSEHGFSHINDVLKSSEHLITEKSKELLSSYDLSVLVISVVLHDSAMHLTEDGFLTLINGDYPPIESKYIKEEPTWDILWNDFISEAKRFDAKKLQEIFGNEKPVTQISIEKDSLTGRDNFLIGEFLRRHHARLAHEIAINGVPGGSGGKKLELGSEPINGFRDLCGFIARSHNMNLRDAVDKLEPKKKQKHFHTHVPYIMVLLRIADYIQIEANRAPKQLLSVNDLSSPISKREWAKHHSIVEIIPDDSDPEALYIDAEPTNALIFEALSSLFIDIQNELDKSWAVLGEVYGLSKNLYNLGITVRRIRTSLDDIQSYINEKSPSYIPKVLKFKMSDSEMMELLIAPLYGDNPEIGIRELMQNSVDACLELKDLVNKELVYSAHDINEGVRITLTDYKDKGGELVIEDHGIGMTLDIIENYFLNIGASFRNSDVWKKAHETGGHSDVYRTGRFGIGLLAAYLLGNEIHIKTRHVTQEKALGLSFSCKKGSREIVVENVEMHIGTTITIQLTEDVTRKLSKKRKLWDWFSLAEPKVVREIICEGETTNIQQSRTVPCANNKHLTGWYKTKSPEFDDVYWTYESIESRDQYLQKDPKLICNGIIVTDSLSTDSFDISPVMGVIDVRLPTLAIYDQDGKLPINLERTELVTSSLPFTKELSIDLSNHLVNEILKNMKPIKEGLSKESVQAVHLKQVKSVSSRRYYYAVKNCSKLLISEGKFIPMDFDLIKETGINTLYVDAQNLGQNQGSWTSEEFKRICTNYLGIRNITSSKRSKSDWIRDYMEPDEYRSLLSDLPIIGSLLLIRKSDMADIFSTGYVPRFFHKELSEVWSNEKWKLLSYGQVKKLDANMDKIANELTDSNSLGFILHYLDWKEANSTADPSIFYKSWMDINKSPYLITN